MSVLFKNAKIISLENGSFKVLQNAYLGVEGEYIDYIGTERPMKNYDSEKDMYDKLLMPGLVNAHTHSAMNILRGIGSDLPLMDWLHRIWRIEPKVREKDSVNGMNMAILEMLACGTTSFSDHYMRPFITQKCVEESGIKANLTRVVMNGEDSTDYLAFDKRVEAIDLYKNYNNAFNGRLKIDWSIHAEYSINEKIAEKWSEEIRTYGGGLHIHLSETKTEFDNCLKNKGLTPTGWFEKLGFFNVPTYAAHCVWLSENDFEILKKHNVTVVHNPTSNMKLASGFAPIQKLIENGISVALGTDGSASNNNVNIFEEMHIASLIHKGFSLNPTVMVPVDIIKMATINGARAQRRFDTGSLEEGKKADIIALNLDSPHLIPDFDTLALITYSAQGSDVCMTMVDGKILYEDGEYYTLDRDRIFAEYKKTCSFVSSIL